MIVQKISERLFLYLEARMGPHSLPLCPRKSKTDLREPRQPFIFLLDRMHSAPSALIQIKIPQRPIRKRSLLGLLHRLGKLLRHHIVLVLLRIHTLREDRLPPRIRLAQSLRRLAKVLEHLLLRRRLMRNDRPRHRIHLQHRPAIRTHHLKRLIAQSHRTPHPSILKPTESTQSSQPTAHNRTTTCPGHWFPATSTSRSTKPSPYFAINQIPASTRSCG